MSELREGVAGRLQVLSSEMHLSASMDYHSAMCSPAAIAMCDMLRLPGTNLIRSSSSESLQEAKPSSHSAQGNFGMHYSLYCYLFEPLPPLSLSTFPAHPLAELAMLTVAPQPYRTEGPLLSAGTCSTAKIRHGVMSSPLPESSQLAGQGRIEDAELLAGLVCSISNAAATRPCRFFESYKF